MPILFNTVWALLARVIHHEKEMEKKKEMKDVQVGKEEVELSLFAESMILYIENPMTPQKKVRTNTVKLQSTKSVYKYCCFLYTNNKEQEREIKKTSPFTITSKKIKYLGINLVKEVKTYNAKNYMTLMKEMKDIQINGNIVHAHELEELI